MGPGWGAGHGTGLRENGLPPDTEQPDAETRDGRTLAAEDLTITREGQGREPFSLRGLSLQVRGGELVTVMGPSGEGKSTVLQALAGLIPWEAGTVTLDGRPFRAHSPAAWRSQVGMAPAESFMVDGSIADNLRLAWRFRAGRGRPRPTDASLREALAGMGLAELALHEEARRLSTGQRQRVALLRRMLPGPAFLLLDEPVANLDEDTTEAVWGALAAFQRHTGAGVLCATHRPPPFAPARAYRLEDGRLEAEGEENSAWA